MNRFEVIGLKLPLIEGPCDLARLLVEAAGAAGGIRDGDIIAVTAKLVSKCLGYTVRLDDIEPSREALRIARVTGEDPRFVELLLRESDDILAVVPVKRLQEEGLIDLKRLSRSPEAVERLLGEYPVLFIVVREGGIWTDAGIDSSNHPPGVVSVPPRRLDSVARRLRDEIAGLAGVERLAVVVCDTEVFLGGGSLDIARGSWGLVPVDRGFGEPDLYGKPKYGGVDAIAHEVCAAAALVMRQAGQGVPAAIIRGVRYEPCECGLRDYLGVDASRIPRITREVIRETGRVLGWRRLVSRLLRLLAGRGWHGPQEAPRKGAHRGQGSPHRRSLPA